MCTLDVGLYQFLTGNNIKALKKLQTNFVIRESVS